MSNARRGVRIGLHTVVLAALVAGTGAVVAAEIREDSGSAFLATPADDAPVTQAVIDAGSADVPLASVADPAQLQHVAPASRSVVREALADGDGVSFTVVVDGVTTEVTTTAATLADALTEAGVSLGWDDEVTGDLAAAPEAGAEVRVGRVTTEYVTDQVLTPHEVEERRTADLLEGETKVVQEGVDGDERVTSAVRKVDGVEISRTTVVSARTTEPVTEIVEVGTRKPAPTPTPAATGSTGSTGGTTSPAPASAPTDPGSNRAIAKDMVTARGWGEDQWSCLDSLWQKESNWNHLARNKSSGAYGIPQSLPANKMASVGSDWQTNPATQITWGLNYIEGRYGTPCGAWDHSKRKNWY